MSAREELLAHTRSILWRAWSTSPEELASAAVDTLMGLGMLVPEGGAQELERFRLLAAAEPAGLSDEQVEALADAANAVWADANHDDLCACTGWPTACVNGHWVDEWRSGAVQVGMRAVIGLWESVRAEADELARLRDRVAELEAERARLAEVMQRGQHWRGDRLVSERTLTQREIRHATGITLRESTEDEYRYCGADLGRSEFPFTCYRRVAHKGQCSPEPDPEPLEDPHDSPLHHAYTTGRDLPEYPNA